MFEHQNQEEIRPKFSEASYREVSSAEYMELAETFIKEIAPSLNDELRFALSKEITHQLLGIAPRNGFGDLHTPILQLNRAWLWPEIANAFPFSPGTYVSFSRGQLWGGEHTSAFMEAENLRKSLNYYDLHNWIFDNRMPRVRQWRNKYLPDLPKRTSKYTTLNCLIGCTQFLRDIQKEFSQWQRDVENQIATLKIYANQDPIPRHLEWLAWLVTHRLDSYHSYHNSTAGPQAFDDRLASIMERCTTIQSIPAIRGKEIFDHLPFYARSIFDENSRTTAIHALDEIISSLRVLINKPTKLSRHFKRYRPNYWSPRFVCDECNHGLPTLPISNSNPKLSPFHLLCRCRDFRWQLKLSNSDDVMDSYDLERLCSVELWIAELLVGFSTYEFPVVALRSYVSSVEIQRSLIPRRALTK